MWLSHIKLIFYIYFFFDMSSCDPFVVVWYNTCLQSRGGSAIYSSEHYLWSNITLGRYSGITLQHTSPLLGQQNPSGCWHVHTQLRDLEHVVFSSSKLENRIGSLYEEWRNNDAAMRAWILVRRRCIRKNHSSELRGRFELTLLYFFLYMWPYVMRRSEVIHKLLCSILLCGLLCSVL